MLLCQTRLAIRVARLSTGRSLVARLSRETTNTALAALSKGLHTTAVRRIETHNTKDGSVFLCDEEPNMLGPELTYGYYPIKLGDLLGKPEEEEFEIVRKLGWGSWSTVWLARSLRDSCHDEPRPPTPSL